MEKEKIKKILCVHQGFELYGSDRSFLLSVQAFKNHYPAAHITAIIPNDGPLVDYLTKVADSLFVRDLAVLRRSEIRSNPFRFIRNLFLKIRVSISDFNNYDLVYINTVVILDYIISSFLFKNKSIIHVREIPDGVSKLFFSFILRASRAGIIYNSKHTEQSYYFKNKSKITVIHNGVKGFKQIKSKKKVQAPLHLLHLGRFNSWKGQDLLLDAIAHLPHREKQHIQAKIVGGVFEDQIYYKDELLDRLVRYELQDIVTILPFSEFPEELYEWADVVVVPSTKPEPFGRVVIEAMSAGRCVIGAGHGGILEIITHLKDGLLFQPNNPLDLSNKIKQLINNMSLVTLLGECGRETFNKKFTDEKYLENFSDYLKCREY